MRTKKATTKHRKGTSEMQLMSERWLRLCETAALHLHAAEFFYLRRQTYTTKFAGERQKKDSQIEQKNMM